MTEIERILEEGIIKEEFIRLEILCEFGVDEKRKKIWAIEIDLLLQVDKVCKKYGLRYFLAWGSMLGAVRHHGFVPWDDDLDISMPRDDYEQLLLHANEFEHPYFLQTPYSDKGYYYSHAKLRNTNTTALDYPFLFQGFNMGIFIDIIPLDYISGTTGREDFNEVCKLISDNNIAMRLTHPYLNERDKKRVASYSGENPLDTYERLQGIAKSSGKTNMVSLLMAVVYGYDRDHWEAELFDELTTCDFHGVETYIPRNYDRILKTIYGDYMKYPPVEKRGIWHGNLYFNPDVPYQKSLKKWESFYDKNSPNTIQMTHN